MKCPKCDSDRVHHSHARNRTERLLKSALAGTYYRCHECGWRRMRLTRGWRPAVRPALAIFGYVGGIAVIGGVIIVVILVLLGLAGVPLGSFR